MITVFKARDLLKSRGTRHVALVYPPGHRKGLYDVTVLVLVTVTQDVFLLTCFKRPNKLLLFYSAHVSFCSNHVTVILNEPNRDGLTSPYPT